MYYVYILKSVNHPHEHYVGYSEDLRARVKAHNSGGSKHTSKFAPWQLITYLGFVSERAAKEFEWYLKTGSGRAFLKKHFYPTVV